ncbi:MAG: TerB family tellurite resistance protein, partial [Gammaproteobacteria bacterium]
SVEFDAITKLLNKHFTLTHDETAELIELAEEEARDLTSYHQFTTLINQHYGQSDRIKILELLWQVANADGEIEKYEEHLIRKISDLLYVSHSDFIAAKHRVLEK